MPPTSCRRPPAVALLPTSTLLTPVILVMSLGLAVGCSPDEVGSASDSSSSTSVASTGTTGQTSTPTTGGTQTTDAPTSTTTGDPSTSTSTGPVTTEHGDTTTTASTSTDPGATDSSTDTTAALSDSSTGAGSSSTGEPPCPEGTILCDGNNAQVCDGMGGFASMEPCPKACAPGLGCVECVPGSGKCDGPVAQKCDDNGAGFVDSFCDEVQGVQCDAQLGECIGACAPAVLGTSYIGCEYYPTVTPNVVGDNFSFAVVVSNVSDQDATITITRGGNQVVQQVAPKNTVQVITLPWVATLKQTGASKLVVDGAYRLRSTQPVTVYQYNPLEYQKAGSFSYTNDASLLMPTNVWGQETVVVTRNTLNGLPGVYAVVARADNTKVELTPSATGKIVQAGGGVAANGTGIVMLSEGDVLQVLSAAGGGGPDISDLTGTRVVSDKPVQVIGAHACSYVPYNITACDHLEEFNLPLDNLAKDYIVSTPFVKAPNQNPQIKARMVRVIATTDATTITYDPPQPGAPAALAKAGDYAEIQTDKDFQISANFKIAVSEYMLGQAAGGGTGDPAMTISVPTAQYRGDYSFHAPTNYESNFANITAPDGTKVLIDGVMVQGFMAIGATGFGVARVQLSNNGDGNHTITGDQDFGVQVYGYGQYTSYWYPGGLDLNLIPQ
jgi:phage baseplate assembly protein gpV